VTEHGRFLLTDPVLLKRLRVKEGLTRAQLGIAVAPSPGWSLPPPGGGGLPRAGAGCVAPAVGGA
jgi:hypothetical protein